MYIYKFFVTLNFKPYFVSSLVTNCLLNIFFSSFFFV